MFHPKWRIWDRLPFWFLGMGWVWEVWDTWEYMQTRKGLLNWDVDQTY